MSPALAFETVLTFIQIVVLIPVIYNSIKLSKVCRNSLPVSLFSFAMISLVIEAVYWIAYNFIRPDIRMPFSAEKIADSATILLLGSALVNIFPSKKLNIGAFCYSVIFVAINISLWIAWSGEWIQDIVFGLPYIYILYVIIFRAWDEKTIKKHEVIVSLVATTIIFLLCYTGIIYTDLDFVINACIYTVQFMFTAWVIITDYMTVLGKNGGPASRRLHVSLLCFLWTCFALYMCGGIYYDIAYIINILAIPALYFAFKRWANDDLC